MFRNVENCYFTWCNEFLRRSQWPRGLRRGSAAVPFLGLRVRIRPGAWTSVCCECCVLSGRGLCDGLITRPEESYRLWCVVVCDLETSRMMRPWPALGRSATGKKKERFLFQNCYISPDVNYNLILLASSINATCLIQAIPSCCNNKVIFILIFFPVVLRPNPTRTMASSFTRFLDHTQRHTTVGRTPLGE